MSFQKHSYAEGAALGWSVRPFQGWWLTGACMTWLMLLSGETLSADRALQRYEFLQIRMGIPVSLVLYAPDQATANQASQAAYDRIRELDRIMSDYDPDSELMQLCTTASPGEPVSVSQDLMRVLSAAEDLSRETDGAFDVTVGPVTKLWRVARRRKQLPDPDRLREALESVGHEHLVLDRNRRRVTLLKEGMRLDLGGIAKGDAADQALKVLIERGVPRALIDAGGDIVAGDPPPDRDHWRIEIEPLHAADEKGSEASEPQTSSPRPPVPPSPDRGADAAPLAGSRRPLRLRLTRSAVATSGDAYQHVEINGVRYSHLVDPNTGLGLTRPSSVTVIASTGMQADALASAVSVLSPDRGLELIEATPEAEAFIVKLDESGQPETYRSSGFEKFLLDE
jgi:FAD:protein FMN transferase